MNQLVAAFNAENPQHLQALLLDLARHGEPYLCLLRQGWHCHVDMNTNTTGSSFKVSSDFKLATPMAAAVQCMERIKAALAALNKV